MKIKILIIALFIYSYTSAQPGKTCKSKEEALEDLNTISKCNIAKSKDANSKRVLNVSVSASRKRHLKINRNKSRRISKSIASFTTKLSKKEIQKAKKFKSVDQVPGFKSCNKYKGDKKEDCFNSEMSKHINKNFYYPTEAVKKNIEGKIWVRFIINTDGKISNLKTLGKKEFKDVVVYIISKLPTFTPAKKNGKKVSVKYSFPINFTLSE